MARSTSTIVIRAWWLTPGLATIRTPKVPGANPYYPEPVLAATSAARCGRTSCSSSSTTTTPASSARQLPAAHGSAGFVPQWHRRLQRGQQRRQHADARHRSRRWIRQASGQMGAWLTAVTARFPHSNNNVTGDGHQLGRVRVQGPRRRNLETNYVGRVDYNLSQTMKLFARFTIVRNERS